MIQVGIMTAIVWLFSWVLLERGGEGLVFAHADRGWLQAILRLGGGSSPHPRDVLSYTKQAMARRRVRTTMFG
jgi:hypothetical protein